MMRSLFPLKPAVMTGNPGLQHSSAYNMFEQPYSSASQQPTITGRMFQVKHECEGWKRLLSFMMEENVQLKTLVPEILSSSGDKVLLAGIEQFHDRFISEDGIISLLRNDVAKFEKLLLKEETETGSFSEQIYRQLEILRNNLQTLETQFSELRSAFFRFLLEKI